jgi:hypothetical protein
MTLNFYRFYFLFFFESISNANIDALVRYRKLKSANGSSLSVNGISALVSDPKGTAPGAKG